MHWHTHTLTKHPDIHTLTHPHTTYSLTYIDTPTHWQNTPTHPHTDKIPWHTHTLTKHPDIHLHWHTHTLTKHPDIHRHTHTLTYSLTYTDTHTHTKRPIHPLILSLSYCIKQFFHHWVVKHLTDHVLKQHTTCTCTYPSSRNTHVHAPTHPHETHHMYTPLPILKEHATCTCTYPNRRRCSTADSNSLALSTAPRMIWNEQNSFQHAYQDAKCR